jgi:Zn-dependent alcohol dehydrogenase
VTAATIANPDISSCAALIDRAKLKAEETVLVNGETGAAGQLAVQIAKRLGAAKVIAVGRAAERRPALAPITLMGSGLGSAPPDRLLAAIGAAPEAAAPGSFKIAAQPVPLSDVEQAQVRKDGGQRIVFAVGAPQQ